MGYFEIICQLCGVSFAIARARTSTEPPEAAWDYYGSDFPGHEGHEKECEPRSETGCRVEPRDDTYEHIAGPGCRLERAYSGANISLAEMKGCRDVRAIVKKDDETTASFRDEDDDEPWERTTRYFFTGTGNGSPDTAPLDNFDKVRHGADSVLIGNNFYIGEDEEALPVHPTCWEIYKRVSERTRGEVDVHGLWRFKSLSCDWDRSDWLFPRHPAVRDCNEQWWVHRLGCEWTVANPVQVPGFAGLLRELRPMRPEFASDAFRKINIFGDDRSSEEKEVTSSSQDPFGKLPFELRLMVQDLLPSKSIAALRVASSAMTAVPMTVFRRLLLEDYPWFWEARELPPEKTNWHELYRLVKFYWLPGMKGLKNRERIWTSVTEICRRIRVHREKGEIRGVTGWEDDADDDGQEDEEEDEEDDPIILQNADGSIVITRNVFEASKTRG